MWENTSNVIGTSPAGGQNYGWASANGDIPNVFGGFVPGTPSTYNNQVQGLFVPTAAAGYGASATATYCEFGTNGCVFSEMLPLNSRNLVHLFLALT